jgi:hypothetical protein
MELGVYHFKFLENLIHFIGIKVLSRIVVSTGFSFFRVGTRRMTVDN